MGSLTTACSTEQAPSATYGTTDGVMEGCSVDHMENAGETDGVALGRGPSTGHGAPWMGAAEDPPSADASLLAAVADQMIRQLLGHTFHGDNDRTWVNIAGVVPPLFW